MPSETIDAKFYIVFFEDDYTIFHAVGYEEYPRVADVMHILKEMNKNKDYGIGEKIYTKKMDIIDADEFDEFVEDAEG